MREVLTQLNAVPGVVASMLCDADGAVLADLFPPRFDGEVPRTAAKVLADGGAGLATVTGALGTIDLRFGDARIVVKPVAGARLLVLCSPAMNMQPLAISTAVALPKLEKLLAAAAGAEAPGGADPDELDFGDVAAALDGGAAPEAAEDVAAELQAAARPAPPEPPALVAAPASEAPAAEEPPPAAAPEPTREPGQLYQALQRINAVIERRKLDPFRTRGAIALKAGFGLAVIEPETPDHDGMLARLQAAAKAVLKETI